MRTAIVPLMFAGTEDIQALKYCGEDMTLSYKALTAAGVKTFVPPHPFENRELWGSRPDTAMKFGNDKAALSSSLDNKKKYNQAMGMLLDKGWQPMTTGKAWRYHVARILGCVVPVRQWRHQARNQLLTWMI
jgi:hypothetical protein